ncbi:hypothetical protein LCL87_03575 [Rhodococcus hoagii]|nr:hypothetical protein [Prescottella equi]
MPTPAQIHTGIQVPSPTAPISADPAKRMPNSAATTMLYRRRTRGSAIGVRSPVLRIAVTTPAITSSPATTCPAISGPASQLGASADPQPNHMNAKNPSMTAVIPRVRLFVAAAT